VLKIVLLLAYILGGEIKIEQKVFDTIEDCATAAVKRVDELKQKPDFNTGLYGVCAEAIVKEA
jgi:hypothetical protein